MTANNSINNHCRNYLMNKNESIRNMIAKAQEGHDAGDEDKNAWKMDVNKSSKMVQEDQA